MQSDVEGGDAMRWVGRFVGHVWHISRTSWVSAHEDLRPRSGVSALVLFLFLMFFIVGFVLVLLGVDVNALDLWLDDHGGWFELAGSSLFRLLCGLILALCAFAIIGGICQRIVPSMRGEARVGVGVMLGAVLIGYFAWFGVVG